MQLNSYYQTFVILHLNVSKNPLIPHISDNKTKGKDSVKLNY